MNVKLNGNDWILISTYLDDKLSNSEKEKVEARLASDASFNQALQEMAYTRRLLWSLPRKRAPRNFTISPEKVKQPLFQPWLRPAMSFVSVAASLLFVVLFASSYIFGGNMFSAKTADQPAAVPEMAMSSGVEAEAAEPPIIINWDPQPMGGGGGDPYSEGYFGPGAGGIGGGSGGGGAGGPGFGVGGGPVETEPPVAKEVPPTEVPSEPLTEESPSLGAPAEADDMSSLILGIPDAESAGTVIEQEPAPTSPLRSPWSNKLLLLIVAGGTALVTGILAILLRRR